jgi:hypothetical protein
VHSRSGATVLHHQMDGEDFFSSHRQVTSEKPCEHKNNPSRVGDQAQDDDTSSKMAAAGKVTDCDYSAVHWTTVQTAVNRLRKEQIVSEKYPYITTSWNASKVRRSAKILMIHFSLVTVKS